MLQEICEYIHNYFIRDCLKGTFEVTEDMVSPLPPLSEGQRFLIIGSAMNDGIYTYNPVKIMNDDDTAEAGLFAETFAGTICALAVPPAVFALAGEIKAWVDKYGENVNSPYTSESVLGVYSYTKGTKAGTAGNGTNTVNWQDVYASRLNRWRKVNFT